MCLPHTLVPPQVGTLACAGFREAIALVRSSAQRAGKKTYTLVMGKPNPAKLANFPEVSVDLRMVICCRSFATGHF